MNIEYIGEHLLPGQIGNFFVILSFVGALLSAISYYVAAANPLENSSWKKIARTAFRIHSLAVIGIMATLFYLIFNHYFEYQYVWQHSSKALPLRYMLSCFWEGQEGSFLLWTFWHVVLGNILMRYAKDWEAPVMTIFSIVQIFLASMLLGIYVLGYKIGSNPFILLREHPDYAKLPFVQIPDYLKSLDGKGLNPLLQNYWMTIHPPILFLGFASTLVPFVYAIAGLWKKRFTEWIQPALPWTFFGVMVLGTGILMGGAWAYESLSFGGFWAWDPVENASLVPWLTFVGAAHVMLIHKKRGESLITAFSLSILTFILILYSTFLTRSGILGDTSVHAFTDLGMSGQLLVYLFFFLILSIWLLLKNWKKIPKNKQEDSSTSREFWMFIGALVLLISSFQIIFTTSIPVINKVFHTNLAPPLQAIKHYNSWQVPFAILIALLIAIGQYFKYQQTEMKQFLKKIKFSFFVSIVIALIAIFTLKLYTVFYVLLLFSSCFAICANLDYFIRVLKGNFKKAGSSIAHVGFGMILLGALISTSKSDVISLNTSGKDISKLGKDFNNNENIMLSKNDTLRMGEYFVTYKGKRKEGVNIYYEIEYLKKENSGNYISQFTLHPLVQTNPNMGNIAEPDTKHFLHKDVYTHITYADLEEENDHANEYKESKPISISVGDTVFASNCIIVLENLIKKIDNTNYHLHDSDIAVGARFRLVDVNNNSFYAEPLYVIRQNYELPMDANVDALGIKLSFVKINVNTGKIDVVVSEKKSNAKEFIIMKAIIFPFINILWMGAILLIIGTLLAIRQRLKSNQRVNL